MILSKYQIRNRAYVTWYVIQFCREILCESVALNLETVFAIGGSLDQNLYIPVSRKKMVWSLFWNTATDIGLTVCFSSIFKIYLMISKWGNVHKWRPTIFDKYLLQQIKVRFICIFLDSYLCRQAENNLDSDDLN